MLKDFFIHRLFIGALVLFVLCVGGGLLYMQHVKVQSAREFAETQERIKQWNERQKQQTAAESPKKTEVPIVEQPAEGGDVQDDGMSDEVAQIQEPLPNAHDDLNEDEIKALYTQLKTEGFRPEKLSEKQLLHLSKVGLNWDYLSPEQQDKVESDFWAQYGLNPPPDGYTYQLHSAGNPVLDENGNAIISKIGNTSIKKSFGGYLR